MENEKIIFIIQDGYEQITRIQLSLGITTISACLIPVFYQTFLLLEERLH